MHGDVDDDAGALLALDELDLAGDAVAFDIGVRARRRSLPCAIATAPASASAVPVSSTRPFVIIDCLLKRKL